MKKIHIKLNWFTLPLFILFFPVILPLIWIYELVGRIVTKVKKQKAR